MTELLKGVAAERARNLHFLDRPKLWLTWPFLPLVRKPAGGAVDYGVLFDVFGLSGKTGFGSTVFFCNLFELPPTEDAMLGLPREVFDTKEELYAAGWRLD